MYLFYEAICFMSFAILFLCFSVYFSIAITSLGEERANLSAFRTFVRFVLVWFCRFPLPPGIWEGLRFVIVALPGLFSNLFFLKYCKIECFAVLEVNMYFFDANDVCTVLGCRLGDTKVVIARKRFNLIELHSKKRVRENSRECPNHKPQPFPDPKRKRKPDKSKQAQIEQTYEKH